MNKMAIGTHIVIITLNVNGQNSNKKAQSGKTNTKTRAKCVQSTRKSSYI